MFFVCSTSVAKRFYDRFFYRFYGINEILHFDDDTSCTFYRFSLSRYIVVNRFFIEILRFQLYREKYEFA